jgi:hypothetical protein
MRCDQGIRSAFRCHIFGSGYHWRSARRDLISCSDHDGLHATAGSIDLRPTGHAPRHALSEVAMAAVCTCPSVIFWADGPPLKPKKVVHGSAKRQASMPCQMLTRRATLPCSGNLTIALKWSQSSAYSSPADPGATSCRPNVRGPQPSVFLFGEADDNSDFSESDDEVVHRENIVEGSAPAAEKRQRS